MNAISIRRAVAAGDLSEADAIDLLVAGGYFGSGTAARSWLNGANVQPQRPLDAAPLGSPVQEAVEAVATGVGDALDITAVEIAQQEAAAVEIAQQEAAAVEIAQQEAAAQGGGGGQDGGGGGGFDFGDTTDFQRELSEEAEGRSLLFQTALGQQAPRGTTAGPFRQFLGRQNAPLQAQFILERALGAQPQGGFKNFLGGLSGGIGRQSQGTLSNLLNLIQPLLTPPEGQMLQDLPGPGRDFNIAVGADPQFGYGLALQSALQGVPREFQPSFRSAAGDAFARFRTQRPEDIFLSEFIQGGQNFFGL